MDLNNQKEQFSYAYVSAVAACAGFATSKPNVDDDSIDFKLSQKGGLGTIKSPQLDLQLKCTTTPPIPKKPTFPFPLKKKNYDELRDPNVLVPRILVVVIVPHDIADWLRASERQLAMRKCGYWLSLCGLPDTGNSTSTTVNLIRKQIFTVADVTSIMNRISKQQFP